MTSPRVSGADASPGSLWCMNHIDLAPFREILSSVMNTLFVLLKKEKSNIRLLRHKATRQPPVPAAQQAHRRRDQQRANNGGIHQHSDGHPHTVHHEE